MKFVQLERLEARDVPAVAFVTNGNDDGAGSFRAAVEAANADSSITSIVVRQSVDSIVIESAVEYTGSQSLGIQGNDVAIAPTAGAEQEFDLFVASGGSDLVLRDLTLRGGEDGLFVTVPADATGTLSVTLRGVTVEDCGLFGVHIDDQTLGSDASVALTVVGGSFKNNGTAALDYDGIRVDEGGEGNIVATLTNVAVDANGADGLELDERGEGSVRLTVIGSSFDGNGFFNEADLDDGIDIDEAGGGGVNVSITASSISGNFDEGLDLNEEDAGSLVFRLTGVTADGNTDEGVKADELGDGNLFATLIRVRANDTGDEEGIALTEDGGGDLVTSLFQVTASGNDNEGIELAENGDGSLTAVLTRVTANGNGNDGIELAEAGAGGLSAIATKVTATGNNGYGIKASQETVGTDVGALLLIGFDLDGNEDGEIDADGVIVYEF